LARPANREAPVLPPVPSTIDSARLSHRETRPFRTNRYNFAVHWIELDNGPKTRAHRSVLDIMAAQKQ
jgi:hypothetical protein